MSPSSLRYSEGYSIGRRTSEGISKAHYMSASRRILIYAPVVSYNVTPRTEQISQAGRGGVAIYRLGVANDMEGTFEWARSPTKA